MHAGASSLLAVLFGRVNAFEFSSLTYFSLLCVRIYDHEKPMCVVYYLIAIISIRKTCLPLSIIQLQSYAHTHILYIYMQAGSLVSWSPEFG